MRTRLSALRSDLFSGKDDTACWIDGVFGLQPVQSFDFYVDERHHVPLYKSTEKAVQRMSL
jgi:hypothetical protein